MKKATTVRKSASKKRATKRKTRANGSLVENINKRKHSGKSRPKNRTTISKKAYAEMQKGWPKRKKKKRAKARRA